MLTIPVHSDISMQMQFGSTVGIGDTVGKMIGGDVGRVVGVGGAVGGIIGGGIVTFRNRWQQTS